MTRHAFIIPVVALALAGCPGEEPDPVPMDSDSAGASSTGMASADASTGQPGASTGADGGSSEGGSSSGGEVGDCQDPREAPPSPFDCSGADGVIMGDVILDAGDDPSVLDGVVRVEGSVLISGTTLTNLDFMGCLQEVTGELNVFDNDSLTNVDGLWSVTEIGTHFVFSENGALVDFDGLPNIEVIGSSDAEGAGNLVIKNNDSLETISGFHSLVGVNNNLTIQLNPVLTSIDGLGGVRVIGNLLTITANGMLCLENIVCVTVGIVSPPEPPPSWPMEYPC